MKSFWLKLLLVSTFVFWATGTAKYTHEYFEHHGKDASVVEDEDQDDSLATPAVDSTQPSQPNQPKQHPHYPCPICQMLGAMSADRSSPPALPQSSSLCIAILQQTDRQAPALPLRFTLPARGPPALSSFF